VRGRFEANSAAADCKNQVDFASGLSGEPALI
jgi:hypothetical protein